MKTNKLVKLGIATFAVAVLGVVPAFTAQADTHVAEQPNTASKPVENGKPSDSEKPEVKPTEEAKPEAKSTANAAETQPSDAPRQDATLKEEKHLPIRYVIELHFKHIGIAGEVEPTKTLTGTVNFGEDLTIDAPTFEGYRLERAYPKILNISYDNLNNFGKTAGSEVYEIDETSKDREYTLTKEGDTIIAHRRLEYETLPLEKPNRSERTLHISFSYTGTPKIMPDGTLPPHRKYYSIDDGKRGITVTIKPGESFTLPKGEIDGYILEDITDVRHEEGRWGATTGNYYKPGETVPYEKFNFYPGVVDGVESDHISVNYSYYRPAGYIGYEKPSQPTEKPAPKPSETPKPEVKPEPAPTPDPAPKDEEKQEPLKYRITYYGNEAGEKLGQMTGTINPGEIINIYKHFDGYEITSKYSWMPNYDMTYDIANEYFYGSRDGYNDMFLEYKKVKADAKPSEEVKPETKPSDTPKPEVKPETKPSETPKPEVKPETKPSETPNPEVKPEPKPSDTSKPEVKPAPKPSDTPKPEVKPETKPSDTPKPEVKPAPKPSDTPKPEVKPEPAPKGEEKQEPLKYRITYYDNEAGKILGQMTGIINPGETINIYKNIDGYEITFKEDWMPNYVLTWDIVNEYFYRSADGYDDLYLNYKKLGADAKPSETPKPEVKPEPKPSDTSKPEVKPAPKPSETPKPEVKPEPKPSETPKPEVKPEPKPSETPKPEVKPEPKPSETPKPEIKPEPKPSETPKPEVKPEPKPSDTSKPEVKPEPKPSDTSKPEVKPELKPQTNSNTAPTAPVKPVGQTSNSKADKPTSKKETPALPNTGEQSSSLSLVGLLLASLGLAGLTYKGRH